jgi:phage-related minor tail protein
MADGGVVSGPTLAVIGEAGPEAVIPLDRLSDFGSGGITVNVAGSVVTQNDLIEAIRRGLANSQRNGNQLVYNL